MDLKTDVEAILCREQSALKTANIFWSLAREKILMKEVKKVTSSVRNAFRQEICNSIGIKRCSLSDFTYNMAMKYKRGGAGENLDQMYMVHSAILRRFAFEHQHLLHVDKPESTGDDDEFSGAMSPSPLGK
ncbi:hypothetical protein WOLCODRAFT_155028 [Wolfiporia cocos MD-104 SS10]|uniref:Uncharacterized protein n=1 Tax=Wolfiporia cocos (strain MD-104) TaxID=742152 RepID=A0A2H3JS83_WOLCO|nr:hypothetical protein WOLCODRAFT_155028 [Wolfiporia cocos MD-104 SS10]